jgi:hypothetical protein
MDARVVEYVRTYAKVCLSVTILETLLHGNVDFPSTNEVEVFSVLYIWNAHVVEYLSVSVMLSKLETVRHSSNSNWRRFSEGCSSVSVSSREHIPIYRGSLYAASRVEEWGCRRSRFTVKVHYTLYSYHSFLVLTVDVSADFMDSWLQLPPLVSQACHKSHTQHTLADQPPRSPGASCVFADISQVSVVHDPPSSHRVSKSWNVCQSAWQAAG